MCDWRGSDMDVERRWWGGMSDWSHWSWSLIGSVGWLLLGATVGCLGWLFHRLAFLVALIGWFFQW